MTGGKKKKKTEGEKNEATGSGTQEEVDHVALLECLWAKSDPYSLLFLSLSVPPCLSRPLGTISQECFHSQAFKKRLSCRGQCVCLCMFMWFWCVCLAAYFKTEHTRETSCVCVCVCVCVCCYRSGLSSIIGYRRRQHAQHTATHYSLSTHTHTETHTLALPPSPHFFFL